MRIVPVLQCQHIKAVGIRVDRPILPHAEVFVSFAFQFAVTSCGAWRQHFEDQVGRPLEVLLGHDGTACLQRKEQIGLNDIGFTEHDIVWSGKDHADWMGFSIRRQAMKEPSDDELVAGYRRERHEEISLDDLMPLPIVRQEQKIIK